MAASGSKLRAARVARGISQQDLAQSVGIDATTVAKIESGALRMRVDDHLLPFAAALGVSVSDLLPEGAPLLTDEEQSLLTAWRDIPDSDRRRQVLEYVTSVAEIDRNRAVAAVVRELDPEALARLSEVLRRPPERDEAFEASAQKRALDAAKRLKLQDPESRSFGFDRERGGDKGVRAVRDPED